MRQKNKNKNIVKYNFSTEKKYSETFCALVVLFECLKYVFFYFIN